MTSCADVRENISAYADNELGTDQRQAFEEHIRNCLECKRELDEMIRIIRLCESMPQQELPEEFRSELHEKLMAVAARKDNQIISINRPKRFFTAKTFASVAAGILLIFLGGSIVRFGLFSGNFNTKSADRHEMTAEAPSQAPSAVIDSMAFDDESGKATENSAGVQSAGGSEMPADSSYSMDYGVMEQESNQSLAAPRSFDMNRSATLDSRDNGACTIMSEAASSKSSEVAITADDPASAAETVAALASANNAMISGTDEQLFGSGLYECPEPDVAALDDGNLQIRLQLVFTEADYYTFTEVLNDTFGEADVQIGAFVTEDRTKALNNLIDQSVMYDTNIQRLQTQESNNSEEIEKLKNEKEELDRQIEETRLNSDFVTVTVYLNKK